MFENFKLIFRLIRLDTNAFQKIAKKESATIDGILIIFLGSCASFVGLSFILQKNPIKGIEIDFTLNNLFALSSAATFFSIAFIFLTYSLSRLFSTTINFREFFRVVAFSYILNLLNLIPQISLLSLWIIVIQYKILLELNKLSTTQAILTILATILSLFAILTILS